MMKKRSAGTIIFGALMIALSCVGFAGNVLHALSYIQSAVKMPMVYILSLSLACVVNIISFVSGVGILKLMEWARKMAIAVSVGILVIYPLLLMLLKAPMTLFNNIIVAIGLGFPLALLYYLTRPSVKEQFK